MNNIFHRYINLPFTIKKPKEFSQSSTEFYTWLGNNLASNELTSWLDNYNLVLSNVTEGFYTSANNKLVVPVHTDTDLLPGENDVVKLNFTWGPKTSKTQWWTVNDITNLIPIENHPINDVLEVEPDIECTRVYTAKNNDLTLSYEQTIDKPSLLNVSQLHSTYNPGNEDRWTLSFTPLHKDTKEFLRWNEAIEIFSDIIYE